MSDNFENQEGEGQVIYTAVSNSTDDNLKEKNSKSKDLKEEKSTKTEPDTIAQSPDAEGPEKLDGPDDEKVKNDSPTESALSTSSPKVLPKTPMAFYHEFVDRFCQSPPQLFHTPANEPLISLNTNGYYENAMIESREFENLCRYFAYKMDETSTYSKAFIKDVQAILSNKARFEGPEIPVHNRYAQIDNTIYIDLANEGRQQVMINADGWTVINSLDSPAKFIRKPGTLAMPEPQKGVGIDDLRSLFILEDDDWVLMVSWLLGAMKSTGPFPILILNGQQGSAKTTTAKLLRDLIDPSTVPVQSLPTSERDLVIAANNSWVLNFDNLSGVSSRLADAFCRISTGGGFRTRKLYKNDEEILFQIKRPVIMNGITDVSTRNDFLDRCVIVDMPIISKEGRLREDQLSSFWSEYKPGVLGCLCDALSSALRNYGNVIIPETPRMADYAQWVSAAEPVFGWESGTFLNAYSNKNKHINDLALESNPVGTAILQLMENPKQGEWSGTPSELLKVLGSYTDKSTIRTKDWPKGANILSNQIRRIAPSLREKDILIERSKSGQRKITVTRKVPVDVKSSPAGPISELATHTAETTEGGEVLSAGSAVYEEGEI